MGVLWKIAFVHFELKNPVETNVLWIESELTWKMGSEIKRSDIPPLTRSRSSTSAAINNVSIFAFSSTAIFSICKSKIINKTPVTCEQLQLTPLTGKRPSTHK